jgi:hypothetical protein
LKKKQDIIPSALHALNGGWWSQLSRFSNHFHSQQQS